jgi:hypothetical protein
MKQRNKMIAATLPEPPKANKVQLTANQQAFRESTNGLDFSREREEAQPLQKKFEVEYSCYFDPAREPGRRYADRPEADKRTPSQFQEIYDKENQVLYATARGIGLQAVTLKDRCLKKAREFFAKKINERLTYERAGWPDTVPFQESGYVAWLRRQEALPCGPLQVRDLEASPRAILVWFFDL